MDKPILKIENGVKIWRTADGLRHRDDGPAVDFGTVQLWYQYDVLHREDGPAIEFDDGDTGWYYRGVVCTLQEYINLSTKSDSEKTLLLIKYG